MGRSVRQNVVLYGAIPLAVSLALIAAYFSGVDSLQNIVSPNLDLPNPDANREFGLLENLQNAYLIAIVVIALLAAKRVGGRVRLVFAGIAVLATFVLLEEIDYGLHYYEIATGVSSYDPGQVRNIHNIGDANRYFKRTGDAVLIVFFGLLPLALRKSGNPAIRAVLPNSWSLLALVVMLAMRSLAHTLQDYGAGNPGTIEKNISEFRELNVYYLGILYVYDIAHRPFTNKG